MSYDQPPPPPETGYRFPSAPPEQSPPPEPRRRWPWIVGGVVVVLLVIGAIAAGTGDSDNVDTGDRPDSTVTPPGEQPAEGDSSTTTAEPAETAEGIPDAARAYFEALASEDLSRMGAMLDSSVEGSPAALYATHQIATVRAAGGSPLGSTTRTEGNAIVVESTTGYDAEGVEQTESVTYRGFAREGDKLTGFVVNDTPVADRIRAGGEPVTVDGVTVRIVTAYQTARGDLTLNVDTTNGRQGVLNVSSYEWALVTPDGRQVALSQNFCCPADPVIQPGATAGYMAAFEQVGLGGTLRYVAFADDYVTEVRFDVPVPA
jgi:hypothetical protein